MMQLSLFDESDRLQELSQLGDPLEKLNGVIDWGMFAPILNKVFKKERKGVQGRPPYPYMLMFKILVLQRLYNISDDQTEYQIKDRISFMRFLGLSINDRVPDAKTIWLFRENIVKADVHKKLFDLFERYLESRHLITRKGSIIDASFVEAPRQRNTREENEQIRNGVIPEEWTPNKLRQKDLDARWIKKGGVLHYGYKDEPKVDADSKLITDYAVIPASVHDIETFEELVDPSKDNVIYGDSAFVGENVARNIMTKAKKKKCKITLKITEKGYRNNPLTDKQKATNLKKSAIRCRVEHVFGFIVNSMNGKTVRTIGILRAKFNIGLTNLIYNMCRYEFLIRSASAG
ncbi:transposase [Fibrobacteres bacterium R8-0-B4]